MAVVVGYLACAKVTSLRRGCYGRTDYNRNDHSIMGRSALISLTVFLDPTG